MDVKSNTDKVCIIGAGSSGPGRRQDLQRAWHPVRLSGAGAGYRRVVERGDRHRRRLRHHLSRLVQEIYRLRGLSLSRGISDLSVASRDARLFARLRAQFRHPRQDRVQHRASSAPSARKTAGACRSPARERPRFYRALVIANGHHHVPRIPEHPRHIHRRDLALARLSQRQAARRQARGGGRLRQFGLRYRRRCAPAWRSGSISACDAAPISCRNSCSAGRWMASSISARRSRCRGACATSSIRIGTG